MVKWELIIQATIVICFVMFVFSKDGREDLKKAGKRATVFLTSKRFIVLMIATWFVYKGIDIDPNWMYLAGFFISIDTLQNHNVFSAFAEFLKTNRLVNKENN